MHAKALSRFIRSTVLFLILALSALAPAGPATAQVTGTLPVLSMAVGSPHPSSIVFVGVGFTEGGDVFIAINDPWGEGAYETRWTTASNPRLDMYGHKDRVFGYQPGGVVVESFEHLCGKQVMVRAYDQATRTWSNVVDIVIAC
jgi:hypothetical protein